MITNLKPYLAYKDSGVPWLGEVPVHWEVKPLKRWVSINAEVLPDTTAADYQFRYIDIGTVGTGFLIREPQQMRFGDAPSRARRVLRRGDTIVSTVRTYLKAVYHVDRDVDALVCSTGFAVLTPGPGTQPRYVSYLAQSSPFTDCISAESVGTAYPAIAESRLSSFHVPVPTPWEQSAIVRFLDYMDRRIRRYIRAKKKLINLLEEYKQALIHRAVTGQIDVRTGQPYPAYKPSGVEWLGDVPVHWDIVPNRAVLRLKKHLVGKASTDYTLLSLTKGGIVVRDLENPEGKFPTSFDTYQVVEPGDIIFCLFDIDETPRAIGLSSLHGMITGAYTVFECTDPVVGAYVYLFYLAMDNGKFLKPLYTGLRKVITKSAFLTAKMPLPTKEEQTAIVEYLDAQTTKIDAAIAAARREIELLREYRTRLIADVVTGKVDVREVAARLPEEPAEEEAELEDTEETAEGEAADNEAAAETFSEEEVEP
ncbi:restriction endonuclease subunit S [Neomoorella carbonis]|uniref:restriction endonuclease subunit S n=1 Tax=Neomoorella carbonis TaxID=3062783 RepID=UPI0032556E61